jgi:antibiotic biosynthesis monooxygenase (ABM) superfamily enzyme
MYPHVTPLIQPETRQRQLERERRLNDRTPPRTPGGPPRYKLALLTWAGAYALITLILGLLGPAMASWPLVVRTFGVSVTMVVALTWLVMPRLTRLFAPWLSASA